ncbi:hypothetical protein [Nocardioides sp. CER19]|uniref:hypothetical protein n=1 Tax=Nocardioides sp. CER19 TaxID=3038538 RepID=UPI0024493339|nr:hypothetical protein [Nocardioides sp. CER19]MDH2415295.1 hypothetical protein [Nocardioides sp. CER19]
MADLPLQEGDTLVPAQLSPCVGGLVRTWTESGTRLWSVPDDASGAVLVAAQGTGVLARSVRAEDRYRETALLNEETGTLVLSPRFPDRSPDEELSFRSSALQLAPAGAARPDAREEFARAINQAVRHVAATFEFLVIEVGGWDAPFEPYAFFALHVDEEGRQLSTVEVSPVPQGSELWRPHVRGGAPGVSVSAPVSAEAIDGATFYLADAVSGLDLLPWDVAFTFGVRPR